LPPISRLAFVIALLMLAISCRERQEAVASEVPTLEIKAEVARPRSATVMSPYDGRVATLSVAEGAAVHAGDLAATIANAGVDRDVAYSRAQLALAEYRLRNAGTSPRTPTSIDDDAKERLRATQMIVDGRKSRLERYEKLFATKDVTADELENARMEYAAATRELAAERRALRNVDVAQTMDPALLRLDVEKARAELAIVEERQKQLHVTAPIDGVVTRVLATQGQSINPREPLFEITDASTLDVRGAIAPELLRHVRAGMPVEVRIFTVPPRIFRAAIRTVIPPTDATGATLSVSVPNPDGVLQPGTAATITVK